MSDTPLNEEDGKPEAPLCRTLADRILDQTRKPEQVTLFTNPATVKISDDVSKHYPEAMPELKGGKVIDGQILIIDDITPNFDIRLKGLVAKQTECFNADAPVQERILIFNQIQDLKKKKREAEK